MVDGHRLSRSCNDGQGARLYVLPLLAVLLVGAPGSARQAPGDGAPAGVGALLRADLVVSAEGTAPVRVDVTYRLRPPPGAVAIPVWALPLRGVAPRAPTATVWEDPAPLMLSPDATGMLVGEVPLPVPARPEDVVVLRLRYRVGADGAAPGAPTRVPLLAVRWPPVEALPGTFAVRVDLPPGTRLEDGFPATWTREQGPPGGSARFRAELPVLPAMVAFRAVPDGAGGPGGTSSHVGPGGAHEAGTVGGADAPAPGFVFWGLFAVFGAIVVGYLVWMAREERREARDRSAAGRSCGPSP